MTTRGEHESLVRWLATPTAYAQRPERVDHVATHISDVFLAGDSAYKLKKPVRYDFLDYSTIDAREHACREELRLNRRLAPNTYLDVLPIVREASGGFRLGGGGDVVDWLVHMRRLPTELTLDALQRRGELRPEHVDRLVKTLVDFYRSCPPLSLTPSEYCQRCLAHVRGNLRELIAVKHHLPRGVVERIHGFQLQLLLLQPALFEERARQGRIVDGHGDLRPEHVCLTEPVTIFDCIEFSADFRRIDVADELAFLAAECDFLGAAWVGRQLLAAFQKQSGDRPPAALLDFYKSYRASVRAKVAALRADQLPGPERAAAAAEAGRHLDWADRYVSPWIHPLVLVVGGLAGTGKTTLACALADALGAECLRTDAIRRELFGPGRRSPALDGGIYQPENRDRVYDELLHRAAALHHDRISVVLDGAFSSVMQLQKATALCVDPQGVLLAVECACPEDVAHERIGHRLTAGHDISDATPEVHDWQRERWEGWPAGVPQLRVDTTRAVDEQFRQVTSRLALLSGENPPSSQASNSSVV